jgi:hypothetical protein
MEEIIYNFLFGDPNVQKALAFLGPLIAGAGKLLGGKLLGSGVGKAVLGFGKKLLGGKAAGAAKGLVGLAGGLIGGKKRAKELGAAQTELNQRQQTLESFQFQNPYANMQNTYEDLTVNTQAADFAAQQQQQALASTLSNLQGAAGSSGIAALAQSLAQQQSTNLQASSASIAQQEAGIKQLQAREEARLRELEARGEEIKQRLEFGRTSSLLDMSQDATTGLEGQKVQRQEQLLGGIGSLIGSGIFGKKDNPAEGFQKFLDWKP